MLADMDSAIASDVSNDKLDQKAADFSFRLSQKQEKDLMNKLKHPKKGNKQTGKKKNHKKGHKKHHHKHADKPQAPKVAAPVAIKAPEVKPIAVAAPTAVPIKSPLAV